MRYIDIKMTSYKDNEDARLLGEEKEDRSLTVGVLDLDSVSLIWQDPDEGLARIEGECGPLTVVFPKYADLVKRWKSHE